MDKQFQEYLISELLYLREAVDTIKNNCVSREEYDSNKRSVIGWIIGLLTLFITIVFGLASFIIK